MSLPNNGVEQNTVQEYRVLFQEWTVWEITVSANSHEHAKELAESKWDAEGPEACKLCDNGTEEWEVL